MTDRKKTPDLLAAGLVEPVEAEVEIDAEAEVKAEVEGKNGKGAPRAKRRPQARPTPPVSSPPGAPPPVWEYRTVTFREYNGWRPRRIDGREVAGWKRQPPIHDYLNQMGMAGWELVSMGERHHNQKEAYFKRPVPQES